MFSKIRILLIVCFCLVISTSVCFGLTADTYADLSQSSNVAQNLISYAANYDGFMESSYVCYQSDQYDYCIAWGDLTYVDGVVSGYDISYIRYYREGAAGSYNYRYMYNTDSGLNVSIDNLVVSNIDGVGSASLLYNQLYFYDYTLLFFVLIVGVCFANLLVRRN